MDITVQIASESISEHVKSKNLWGRTPRPPCMADTHSALAHSHSTPLAPPNSKVWIRPWWCHSFPFSEPFALAISFFGLHRGSLLGAGVILTMREHRHVYLSTRVHWPTLRKNMRENIRPLSSSCPPVSRELALCRCLL